MNRNVTRSMLLDSFIRGDSILLYVREGVDYISVAGQVTGLDRESGFTSGGHLRDFMVEIQCGTTHKVYTTYVRTVD